MIALFFAAMLGAHAHAPGLSHASVEADAIEVTFAEAEALQAPDVQVSTPEGPCVVGAWTDGEAPDADSVTRRAALDCPDGPRTYTAGFWGELFRGHRHMVTGGAASVVLAETSPVADLGVVRSGFETAMHWLVLGAEHVWEGLDHLAFLLALLLAAASTRELLMAVSGFTVAHSITLTLAALGFAAVPGWIVEPAIAASVVWAGLENLRPSPPRRRVVITALLGLVHGLGFAGLLAELGLPTADRTLALAGFHAGVEVGQLALVLPAIPLVLLARKDPRWMSKVVPVLSVGIALTGAWWLFERVV
jgi:hydrogenase/urease accessory protein HupE